jgi:hypothetical protein
MDAASKPSSRLLKVVELWSQAATTGKCSGTHTVLRPTAKELVKKYVNGDEDDLKGSLSF